jgi:hypothetical protein
VSALRVSDEKVEKIHFLGKEGKHEGRRMERLVNISSGKYDVMGPGEALTGCDIRHGNGLRIGTRDPQSQLAQCSA